MGSNKKRIEKAAEGDFVITIYNPKSKGRKHHLEIAIDLIKNIERAQHQ